MSEDRTERALTDMLQTGLGLSQGQEDSLWSRFEARRSLETAAWAAFATGMAVLGARLRPALRSPYRAGFFVPAQQGGA
jgi:hypothetical protein